SLRIIARWPKARKRLVDGVFQGLARTELGHASLLDLDGFAGARVAAGAGGALGNGKSAKTDQGDRTLLFQGGLDGADEGFEGAAGVGLGEVGLGGDMFDELGFVH